MDGDGKMRGVEVEVGGGGGWEWVEMEKGECDSGWRGRWWMMREGLETEK